MPFNINQLYLIIISGGVGLFILLSLVIKYLVKINNPLSITVRAVRNIIIPTGTLLYVLLYVENISLNSPFLKIVQTVVWIGVLWVVLSLLQVFLFIRAEGDSWRAKVPGLLIDIIRFATIVIGGGLIIAKIWDKDAGGFLATLGVGSIVLGLALQDTLGSLMAGIALLFERPFNIGDWVKSGDILGKVVEMNWRSVRLRTRENEIVIIPNFLLGKEKIVNYSKPSSVQGVKMYISFSYNDPPNKVKHVLSRVLMRSKDVLNSPKISIRTKSYLDSGINYEMRFFIDNYDFLPEIESEIATGIWYAAKRNSLTIPYPIRTVYKTEIPQQPVVNRESKIKMILKSIDLLAPLSSDELESLAQDSAILNYAKGEKIITQGEEGELMYIIVDGEASVLIESENHEPKEVAQLSKGQYFGEMGLLTGESRAASVVALVDLELIGVYKQALSVILESRPELAGQLSDIIEARKAGLNMAKQDIAASKLAQIKDIKEDEPIFLKIKKFFSI